MLDIKYDIVATMGREPVPLSFLFLWREARFGIGEERRGMDMSGYFAQNTLLDPIFYFLKSISKLPSLNMLCYIY